MKNYYLQTLEGHRQTNIEYFYLE